MVRRLHARRRRYVMLQTGEEVLRSEFEQRENGFSRAATTLHPDAAVVPGILPLRPLLAPSSH
jgi:hypothetical protein